MKVSAAPSEVTRAAGTAARGREVAAEGGGDAGAGAGGAGGARGGAGAGGASSRAASYYLMTLTEAVEIIDFTDSDHCSLPWMTHFSRQGPVLEVSGGGSCLRSLQNG